MLKDLNGSFSHVLYLSQQQNQSHEVPIVFDTGASLSLTPFASDFVEPIRPCTTQEIQGIGNSLKVKGIGWVEWNIRDMNNNVCVIRTQAYHVPDCHIRLFSPQVHFQEEKDPNDKTPRTGMASFDYEKVTFTTHHGQVLNFPWQRHGNILFMLLDNGIPFAGVSSGFLNDLKTSDVLPNAHQLLVDNHNLPTWSKELQIWHFRLCHAGHYWIQDLMKPRKGDHGTNAEEPFVPTKFSQTKSSAPPKCPACIMAKHHKRGAGSQHVINKPESEMAIRRDATAPGSHISTDQFMCSTPGRLPNTFGKEASGQRYHGGTVFYYHYSGCVHLHCQVSLHLVDFPMPSGRKLPVNDIEVALSSTTTILDMSISIANFLYELVKR